MSSMDFDESELSTVGPSERSVPDRVRSVSPRFLVLVVLGAVLLTLAATGQFTVESGIDITEAEAFEIARPHVDFEYETEASRLVRQGAALRPVWAIAYSIPGDGGRGDFERLTTVEVDANSGEVLRISTDNGG